MLWIGFSMALLAIVILLLIWIYYSGGGTLRTKELTERIQKLKEEKQDLKETNEVLRSSLDSSGKGVSQPVSKATQLVEELVSVREALKDSESAKRSIEEKYEGEIGPDLVKEILSSKKAVSTPLKRRLAHEILVGSIGRDILKGLDKGEGLEEATADAGVPLKVGRERARLLKKTGYLDNKLNLTDWGSEAIEL